MNVSIRFILTLFSVLVFVRCTFGVEKNTSNVQLDPITKSANVDSVPSDSATVQEEPAPVIKYTSLIIPKDKKQKDSAMKVFKETYSSEQRYKILAINRLDQKNSWRADTLSIPENLDLDFLAYAPFPQNIASLSSVSKMMIFSYPIQAFAYYENGKLIKWGPTSMGKKSAQTKRGLTFANWKKELAISTVNSEWELPHNVNIYNKLGIGWHQYELPGFPASHSCLRMLAEDAQFMYDKVDTWVLTDDGQSVALKGTPVFIFGDWAWGEKKPWKQLSFDPNATTITEAELDALLQPRMAEIMEAESARGSGSTAME